MCLPASSPKHGNIPLEISIQNAYPELPKIFPNCVNICTHWAISSQKMMPKQVIKFHMVGRTDRDGPRSCEVSGHEVFHCLNMEKNLHSSIDINYGKYRLDVNLIPLSPCGGQLSLRPYSTLSLLLVL